MTIANKLLRLKDDFDAVYEAGKAEGGGGEGGSYDEGFEDGKKSEYDTFWDTFQENGKKVAYAYAFYHTGWRDANFKPKYDIRPNNASDMFNWAQITDLVGILRRQGVVLDFSGSTTMLRAFSNFNKITELGVLNLTSATDLRNMCYGCTLLRVIELIIFSMTSGSSGTGSAFYNCPALEEVRFSGVLNASLDLHWSTKLSKASIESLYSVLTMEGGAGANTITLSLTAVNKAFETSEGANDGSTSDEWENLYLNTPWRTVLS